MSALGRNGRRLVVPPTEDRYYNAAEIAALLTKHVRPIDRSSVYRWMLKGVRGVKLRSVAMGGQRLALWSWVDEFFAARSADMPGEVLAIPQMEQARAAAAGAGLDQLLN